MFGRKKDKPPRRFAGHERYVAERQLTDEDITDFLAAGDARPWHLLFTAMEGLMNELGLLHPRRVVRLRKDLEWLRKEAARRNLTWGEFE